MKLNQLALDFSLLDQEGKTFRLLESLGSTGTVVFFYPKDDTAVCSAEVCAFRDEYRSFVDGGIVVVGISGDTIESHRAFASKTGLPYRILSDRDGKVRRAWGVPRTLGFIPGRVTYVLDSQGVVKSICSDPLRVEEHVKTALASLKA
ncbi:MAG: peroxiredoxin [Fimbriimonas sp.]|nr:peroxiredoxin [Fimbriimonas sp.]